jgi:hypothetical protein
MTASGEFDLDKFVRETQQQIAAEDEDVALTEERTKLAGDIITPIVQRSSKADDDEVIIDHRVSLAALSRVVMFLVLNAPQDEHDMHQGYGRAA